MVVNSNAISVAVTLLSLILAIFGAQWLNQRSNERLFEQFGKRIDDLNKRMDDRFAGVDQRLDRIERQLEAIFKPVLPSR